MPADAIRRVPSDPRPLHQHWRVASDRRREIAQAGRQRHRHDRLSASDWRPEILPPSWSDWFKDHPGLHVRVITASDAISERILAGEFDFGIDLLGATGSDSGLMQKRLFNDKLWLIARHGHRLTRLVSPDAARPFSHSNGFCPSAGNRHRGRLVQLFELAALRRRPPQIECSTTAFLKAVVSQTDYVRHRR